MRIYDLESCFNRMKISENNCSGKIKIKKPTKLKQNKIQKLKIMIKKNKNIINNLKINYDADVEDNVPDINKI